MMTIATTPTTQPVPSKPKKVDYRFFRNQGWWKLTCLKAGIPLREVQKINVRRLR